VIKIHYTLDTEVQGIDRSGRVATYCGTGGGNRTTRRFATRDKARVSCQRCLREMDAEPIRARQLAEVAALLQRRIKEA